MVKIFLTLLCTMFLTSCNAVGSKQFNLGNKKAKTDRNNTKLCVFGNVDSRPALWINHKRVILKDDDKSLSLNDMRGSVLAAVTEGENIYALCGNDKELVLWENNNATVICSVEVQNVAEIVVENGVPAAYFVTTNDVGEAELKRYCNGKTTTLLASEDFRYCFLRDIAVVNGKVYGALNTASQFGEAAVLADGKVTLLEKYMSEAYQIKIDGTDVFVCGSKFTGKQFDDSPEGENPSSAAIWRNGKAKTFAEEGRAMAIDTDKQGNLYAAVCNIGVGDDKCTLWKNGKKIKDITSAWNIEVVFLSVNGDNILIVGSEESEGIGGVNGVFVWENGKKTYLYEGAENVQLHGATCK
ncbi:hypothetical protein [Prevotella sp. OH937_COT-195]|uniref:hypothetical protein n=1 Tax=Prevotella sp. OH937_COT-195 TaxID=2491051 RepID=UPI000F6548E3|nr:hypothetical protein [Prevotella sp. OH937_COT-195]RRD01938.1 hypothetical protein EII32_05150 [Prevotella sp. OH937_COT-195]